MSDFGDLDQTTKDLFSTLQSWLSNTVSGLEMTGVATSNPLISLELVAGQLGEFTGGYRTEEQMISYLQNQINSPGSEG
ncbi:hypothetical protein [Inquilinus sp. OTU3971]|uniref:hypothetical protein n=1 Tax=Inquilinus sp. OTU3971 TaxID=3043855 RepID=UPI00313CB4F2